MSQHSHPRVLRFSWLLGFYGIAMTKNPVNLVNPVFTQFPLRCGRARSDVFDGLAWRGVSEVKRTVAFCFRWSLPEEKQISLAAPHHRKVSAPRPPLSAPHAITQPTPSTHPKNIPHCILSLQKLKKSRKDPCQDTII